MDQTISEAGVASPPRRTGSAESGRGDNDRRAVELAASVALAGTSEVAPSKVVNAAVASEDAAWQAKLERAEEKADQLYRLAEAAQAAVDVARAKLAQAEAETDRLERSRTAVAAELYRQTNAHEAMQVSMASAAQAAVDVLRQKLAQAEAEINRLERSRTAVAAELYRQTNAHEAMQESDARQRELVEFSLRGEIEKLRRDINRTERQRREQAEEAEAFRVEIAQLRLAAAQAQQEAAERGASLRAIEGEATKLRALLGERDAAVTAAHERSRAIEARLAEARWEIEETRAQLETATKEKAERGAAVETLKAELAARRRDLSATRRVAHELMTASTVDLIVPQKPNQGGAERSSTLGFGRSMRARAIKSGNRARDAQRWQVAARYYRRALARDPFDAPTLVQYGHALKEAGHLSEAEAAYQRSLACEAGVADTHLQLGHVLKLQGRATAAQSAFLRAFALDPTMPYPTEELAALGWSPTHLSRLCALPETPGISQLQSLRKAADAARDRRDWPNAARLYEQVVAADPTALDIAVQLGHAHKEMGDLERAAHAYYSVLEATPADDDLHLQIGHLEKLRGNLTAAAAHYKKAGELNRGNVDALRESEALSSLVREICPKEDIETRPGEERTDGGRADHHTTDDLRFDARAGEIYQQLVSALA